MMVYLTIALLLGHQLGWLKWPLIVAAALVAARWLHKRERDQQLRKLMDRIACTAATIFAPVPNAASR